MFKYYFVGTNRKAMAMHRFLIPKLVEYYSHPVAFEWIKVITEAKEIMEAQARVQGQVFYYMYETEQISDHPDVRLIGPSYHSTQMWKSKVFQYERVKMLDVPVPWSCTVRGQENGKLAVRWMRDQGCERMVVSEDHGKGGEGTHIIEHPYQITWTGPMVVAQHLPDCSTVSVAGVNAPKQTFLYATYDNQIEGTKFRGTSFPPKKVPELELAKRYAQIIGDHMRATGYYGLFVVDFIYRDGEIWFTEVNARKPGSCLFSTFHLIVQVPGQPTPLELEYMATIEGRLPFGLKESTNEGFFSWQQILGDHDG